MPDQRMQSLPAAVRTEPAVLLTDEVRGQIRQALSTLTGPVKLITFMQELDCRYCPEDRMLAREIATLSDKIQFENHNFVLERPLADKYRIERTPALVVEGARDYGIRFYGIPAGFEFASLLEAIKMVSAGQSELSPFIREQLRTLTLPLDIKVFVTLTCPYCPTQVHLAHRMAMASDLITASMVESAEFPEFAAQFKVLGVPKTVVNNTIQIEGAMPDEVFVSRLFLMLAGKTPPPLQLAPQITNPETDSKPQDTRIQTE
jgi:glutaredoxin-like protein